MTRLRSCRLTLMLQNLWLSPNFTDTYGKRGRGTGKEILERPYSRQLMLLVTRDTSLRGGASPRSAGPRSSSGGSAGIPQPGVWGGTTLEQELFWRYIISSTESSSLEATVPLQLAELNSSSWQTTVVQSVRSNQVRHWEPKRKFASLFSTQFWAQRWTSLWPGPWAAAGASAGWWTVSCCWPSGSQAAWSTHTAGWSTGPWSAREATECLQKLELKLLLLPPERADFRVLDTMIQSFFHIDHWPERADLARLAQVNVNSNVNADIYVDNL